MKKIFILAGETSGDLHGANLCEAMLKLNSDLELMGWGGDRMKQVGVKISKHINELAFMGFTEVLLNLRTIFKNFEICKKQISSFQPDAVILIDYPGFNLRMAKWLKQNNYPVIYYISPQIWAWKESRIKIIKQYVDKMLVILPFEKAFYEKYSYHVDFVGHPLIDEIEKKKTSQLDFSKKNSIALLPGSRKQEIKTMLPIMLDTARLFPNEQFIICGINTHYIDFYKQFVWSSNVTIEFNKTYEVLSKSKAALVTSGTATLETALFNVPQIVCYKGNYISYLIAKQLVKIKYISLVNLILDQQLIDELIQHDCSAEKIKPLLTQLINKSDNYASILNGYKTLIDKLGSGGASQRAAKIILNIS